MERTINLSSEQYENFLSCLYNLRDVCNDVDIRNGMIRQRTNDKTTIFEMDLDPLILDSTIGILDLRNKIDIFKVFSGQEVEISIFDNTETELGYFIVSDQYSSIKIKSPTLEYMDNKFIDQDQMEHIYALDEETLLLECEIQKIISDRIKVITTGLHANSLQAIFSGETAALSVTTQSKDQHAKFVQDIIMNIPLENSFANMTLITFKIDHDADLQLKMYRDAERNITTNSFKTSLGDIDIRMYSNSSVLDLE